MVLEIMPIVDQYARITTSTETSFDVFANVSLKPLLRFIAAECVTSMQQLPSGPGSNFPIVDFVVQLLLANKAHLELTCRCSNDPDDASGSCSFQPVPSAVSASPDARDAGTGTAICFAFADVLHDGAIYGAASAFQRSAPSRAR